MSTLPCRLANTELNLTRSSLVREGAVFFQPLLFTPLTPAQKSARWAKIRLFIPAGRGMLWSVKAPPAFLIPLSFSTLLVQLLLILRYVAYLS